MHWIGGKAHEYQSPSLVAARTHTDARTHTHTQTDRHMLYVTWIGLVSTLATVLVGGTNAVACENPDLLYVNGACRSCFDITKAAQAHLDLEFEPLLKTPGSCSEDDECTLFNIKLRCYGSCPIPVPKVAVNALQEITAHVDEEWCSPAAFATVAAAHKKNGVNVENRGFASFCPVMMPGCAMPKPYCAINPVTGLGTCKLRSGLSIHPEPVPVGADSGAVIPTLPPSWPAHSSNGQDSNPGGFSVPTPAGRGPKLPLESPSPSQLPRVPELEFGAYGYAPEDRPTTFSEKANKVAQQILTLLGLL